VSDVSHSPPEQPDDGDSEATPCAYTEYREGRSVDDLPRTGADANGVEKQVWDAIYEVEDPEMPVSVVDLGLIYDVTVAEGRCEVEMTLTYTGCPARDMLTEEIEETAANVDGVEDASIRLVWTPEWTLEMVTEDGKEDLREFGVSI
jgi:metal-sulfur cluster biosynthetic enzyme